MTLHAAAETGFASGNPQGLPHVVIRRERTTQQIKIIRQAVEPDERRGIHTVFRIGAQRGPLGAAADRAADMAQRHGRVAVPCLPHGLPPRRAGRAARRCEIRCGFHGARLAQPPVGLFLSAGSYAHGVLRRAGDPVDSLTRIPFRPQHVASSAPGFPVREVSPCTEIGRFVLSSLPYRQKQPEIGLLLSDGITREVYRTINILPR